jgi:hypothetical protein
MAEKTWQPRPSLNLTQTKRDITLTAIVYYYFALLSRLLERLEAEVNGKGTEELT